MSALLIGGTGTTGRPLSRLLPDATVASRNPGPGRVRFDWAEPSTFAPALDGVRAVYLVPPPAELEPMRFAVPFFAAARAAGVRRVVLLGSLIVLPDAPGVAELVAAVRSMPEPVVLRPSGFMQNLLGDHPLAVGLRERGELVSAAGDGKLGWIDAADIAAVAARALTDPAVSGEHLLTGPEALSYAEVAEVLAEVTGRPVRHRPVRTSERREVFRAAGMPEPFATALAAVDRGIRNGEEDLVTGAVAELTGRAPRSLREFALAHSGTLV
ncbi:MULTISPECIES: ergot alkaloid biosynthesis protein [unclassified Saccharopolyspora]|uniref:NmrA family NAD(P)-binding protein n=1 Tax=unclassified Saccharopolyspora TaxID=2646250 RepID=UPI001CD21182|nr:MULTISPECIES: ergot alkaloid biosynthesis protein [unclassified Saccharopolyspora]MCA1186491.1 ergot alkaloid biosynthesis protein [Saccharopolyspora sp. 6T]MCA1194870.1 ergot alkaloid biosynthesis protein [Saccharopolyspora sp. 6V]MCA1227138.1 ergot alkaloid biosynthesis protein [Saccharopolyspora sp. 6M]MCA1282177.1 ergot alkaloid biosynthesis protein [Saccharopolyspora sp. 7B]